VRVALRSIATRFSDDAPSIDERVLRRRYAALEAWPADAQLGLFILAWMLGPGFALAGFRESCNRLVPDFVGAARSVTWIGSPNPTIITLGGIARSTLANGAAVVHWNLDPEALYWPLDLSNCASTLDFAVPSRARTRGRLKKA
jgi:hypothetical protein